VYFVVANIYSKFLTPKTITMKTALISIAFLVCCSYSKGQCPPIAIDDPACLTKSFLPPVSIITLHITSDFGANPNDTISDQAAFDSATRCINARGGYVNLIIDKATTTGGKYLVGGENSGYASGQPYYRRQAIFLFRNCRDITITGELDGVNKVKIKYNSGLHYGTFNDTTGAQPGSLDQWNPSVHSLPNLFLKACKVSDFIHCQNCNNVVVNNIDADGNISGAVLGGNWGIGSSRPIEIPFYGIFLLNSSNVSFDNIYIHHFGMDGAEIKTFTILNASAPDDSISISNSALNYNGRNGISWTGGVGLKVTNTTCNKNGSSGLPVRTAPGAGIDIEPEEYQDCPNSGSLYNSCQKGVFTKCEFLENLGNGVAITDGKNAASGKQTFNYCDMGGNNAYALWLQQKACTFNSCNIFGTASIYQDATYADTIANVFNNSQFTDCYYGTIVNIPGANYSQNFYNVLGAKANSCIFTSHQSYIGNMYCMWDGIWRVDTTANPDTLYQFIPPVDSFMRYNNCEFTNYTVYNDATGNNRVGWFRHSSFTNCKFKIVRTGPGTYNPIYGYVFEHCDGQTTNNNSFDNAYQLTSCESSSCSSTGYVIRDIKYFGAKGDGTTDDQPAFDAAESYFNARGGKGRLVLSAGTYKIGKQTWSTSTHSWLGDPVLQLVNVQCMQIVSDGAVIKFNPTLMAGKYDSLKATCATCGVSVPGVFIYLQNCTNVEIKRAGDSSLVINGNMTNIANTNAIVTMSHFGIQIENSSKIKVDGVKAYDFAGSGFVLRNNSPSGTTISNSSTSQEISFSHLEANNNAASGILVQGGIGVSLKTSKMYNNGLGFVTGFTTTGKGLDLAPIGGVYIKDFTIDSCDIYNNKNIGITAFYPTLTTNLTVNRTKIAGQQNLALSVDNVTSSYNCSRIYGSVYLYGSTSTTQSLNPVTFSSCYISDCDLGTSMYKIQTTNNYLLNLGVGGKTISNVEVTNCIFKTFEQSPLFVNGNANSCTTPSNPPKVNNCIFTLNFATTSVNSGTGVKLVNTLATGDSVYAKSGLTHTFTSLCSGSTTPPVTAISGTIPGCTSSTTVDQPSCSLSAFQQRSQVTEDEPDPMLTEPVDVSTDIIRLSPNPTNGKLQLSVKGGFKVVDIIDNKGMLLQHIVVGTKSSIISIDLSRYPAGMYLLKTTDNNNKVVVKKVIKQ
jgi:hypothetical protein